MSRPPAMALLSYLYVAGGAAVIAYAGLLAYAWFLSDRLIFVPPPATYADGPDILRISTPDGVTLAARYLPRASARRTIVYFHGNAEDLGRLEPFLRELGERLDAAVFAWDYRGYGLSGGTPAEPAVLRDARTVLAYVRDRLGVPTAELVLFGCSVGGGPAVEAAATEPVAGLILQSAFTSAFRVMTQIRLLPFDKFDNLAKMPRVKCPVLVIHGTADEVVSFCHAPKLLAAAGGPNRHLWVEGAGHNDLVETAGDAYWEALREFLRGL